MGTVKIPPLKAKQPGRSGHTHTLASFPLDENGQVQIYIECRCGCSGYFSVGELLEHVGYLKEMGNAAA